MALTLTLCCVLAAGVLATGLSRPATDKSRRRSAARRAALVSAHPERARTSDVVAALRRGGCSENGIRTTLEQARDEGHTPTTLWLWLEVHGVEAAPWTPRPTSQPSLVPAAPVPAAPWAQVDAAVAGPGRVDLNANVRRETTARVVARADESA